MLDWRRNYLNTLVAYRRCVNPGSILIGLRIGRMRQGWYKLALYYYYDANGHYSKEPLSYSTIENYVKTEFKTHRSAGDQEAGYIADIYRESLHLETS